MNMKHQGSAVKNRMKKNVRKVLAPAFFVGVALTHFGCTGQLKDSFKFKTMFQTFASKQEVNTKIDLLWVVDNSSSMDVSQTKLRQGLSAFADEYLKTYWDIRIAVISTDVYLANAAFNTYVTSNLTLDKNVAEMVQPAQLKSVIQGRIAAIGAGAMAGDSILQRISPYATVANNATDGTLNTDGSGNPVIPVGALVPGWLQRLDYAKLKAGIHDGPTAGLCASPLLLPYFHHTSINNCALRDNAVMNLASTDVGTTKCLNTSLNGAVNCVNTLLNNTVRSGRAIINTTTPNGYTDTQWSQVIRDDFMINATTGSVGHGSERGMSSVLEFIKINEADAVTKFFRKDSLRGIIFLGDEDDQSTDLPAAPTQITNPYADYKCDQAQLIALNPASAATIQNSYCCSTLNIDGSPKCRYGKSGTSCTSKTVDGSPWKVSICPDSANLIAEETVKDRLDTFFLDLDEKDPGESANYFIVSIVPQSFQTLQDLQNLRQLNDVATGSYINQAVDRGDRYLRLGTLVGNGSLALELGETNYDTLLEEIGRTIVEKKATFTLEREPTGFEEMSVSVSHADGTTQVVPASKLLLQGKVLKITDAALVLTLKSTDFININYQPKTAF